MYSGLQRRTCMSVLTLGTLASLYPDIIAAQNMRPGEVRTALLIGNADYRNARLRTPLSDVQALQATLRRLGFQVQVQENASQITMVNSLRNYLHLAEQSDVRLVYFAGHGVQWRGRNYLIPVDLELQEEEELARRAIDLTDLVERLASVRAGLNIVIVDACRDNPFSSGSARLADARRPRTRGLTSTDAIPRGANGLAALLPPAGTVVAFSTAPGSLASDGAGARNSIYARHLLARLEVPGQTIETLFKQVRIGVAQETQHAQIPWETSSLVGEFCFRLEAGVQCGSIGQNQPPNNTRNRP